MGWSEEWSWEESIQGMELLQFFQRNKALTLEMVYVATNRSDILHNSLL